MTGAAPFGSDDVVRYAFRQGPGRGFVAPLEAGERPLTTSFGSLPETVATDRLAALVWGTVDLLEETPYPALCTPQSGPVADRIQHALVMAFGLQRREPSNLFNDHRACASVRSRFPVHAFVHTADQAWWLDVYRHGLLPIGDAIAAWPADQPLIVALAGRYTHLPSLYGRLRGPLVELEVGIGLRSLWVALELLGLAAELRLPGSEAGRLMRHLALEPHGEWSAPLAVAIEPAAASGASPSGFDVVATGRRGQGDDPSLDEVVAVNRTALDVVAVRPPQSSRGEGRAIPGGLTPSPTSWAEVLWARTAGRMPRRMAGVAGGRRRVSATAVTDALAWLGQPPPTPILQEVARQITASVAISDAAGFTTGLYRVARKENERAELELVHADPALPGRLEACYGHGLTSDVGCAVRHANLVWLLSIDVPALVATIGPGGWTLAQYACGWMAHGLCLAAAAHGLYARPNRAFDDIALQPVVGMRPGEMVLLSVVSGSSRFREPMLDLRT
ncbi:MAG: hypothetical protein QOK39_1292 [Acidimicrobiaceae bacterium]|nr:hypothetical protein [Acidimicrobiaceae bacterium]